MTTSKFFKNKIGFTRLNFSKKNLGGFTLVETLIAIGILLIAVVGPISLIGDALHKLYYAKDEMIAINLAQEGVEVVRMVRDTNMLAGTTPWDTGFNGSGAKYVIDATAASPLVAEATSADENLTFDITTGLYHQKSAVGVGTQFSRYITTDTTGLISNKERKIISTVTWKTGGTTGTITSSEYLYDWAQI